MKKVGGTRIAPIAVSLLALSATWHFRPIQFAATLKSVVPIRSGLVTSAQPDTRLDFAPAYGERRIYPHSVIPGGIASVDELKDIVAHDPEIAEHLKDFDLQRARIVKVTNPRAVYVSYRIGSNIFWTTKRLTLAEGESLITDGTRTLRGRCGNDVSDVAVEPASSEEPPIADLDTPMSLPKVDAHPELDPFPLLAYVPPDDTSTGAPNLFVPPIEPGGSPAPTPPIGTIAPPPGSSLPPFIFPPFGPPGNNAPGPAIPPVSTPEPSTLLLVLVGAAGLGLRHRRGKRK